MAKNNLVKKKKSLTTDGDEVRKDENGPVWF